MSALAYQQNGYLTATKSTGSPRIIEYQLFSRITGQLSRCVQSDHTFPDLVAALNENQNLWQTLALDIIDSDNELPAQLRAQLFYLFEFTRKHTSSVLRGEADAQALIDINTSIMRGLRQSPPDKGTD